MPDASRDPWNEIRDWLNTPQQLRFTGREQRYVDLGVKNAIMLPIQRGEYPVRLKQGDGVLALLDTLLQRANPPPPRLVALIGGPGSGKSFTVWRLQQDVSGRSADSRLDSFYLSLALVQMTSLPGRSDLYDTAHYIARSTGCLIAPPSHKPEQPCLFFVDDASLSIPEGIVLHLVNNHLQRYPADRIILLLQDNHPQRKDDPFSSFDLDPHEALFLELCGFAHANEYERGVDEEALPRIEGHRACWPLVMEARNRYPRQLDTGNWYEFHNALRVKALQGTKMDYIGLVSEVYKAMTILWLPARNDLTEESGPGGGYPPNDVFTHSEMGLVFATSAAYASLHAEGVVSTLLRAPNAADKLRKMVNSANSENILNKGREDLPPNRVLSDLLFAAYLSTLTYWLTHVSLENIPAELLVRVRESLLYEARQTVRQLLYAGYRRSMEQFYQVLFQLAAGSLNDPSTEQDTNVSTLVSDADDGTPYTIELRNEQRQALHEALVKAFPTNDNLALMMGLQLQRSLDDVEGNTRSAKIYNLIVDLEAQGQLSDLIKGALIIRGRQLRLRAFVEDLIANGHKLGKVHPRLVEEWRRLLASARAS